MALSPQQLQALFQSISSGQQGGFAQQTPDMSQDDRNQWINMYGTGGTQNAAYQQWYQQNQGALNRQGPMYQPGGMFYNPNNTSGSQPLTTPQTQSPQTPNGFSMGQGYQTQPTLTQQQYPGGGSQSPQPNTAGVVQPGGTGINGPAANPYLQGGQASDPRIFNGFAPPVNSVGGATYQPGAGQGANPPAITPGGNTPTQNTGGSGQMVKPKGYQINPMYYKGWNTGGGGFGR